MAERFSTAVAHSKSDRFDAYVLAELAREDLVAVRVELASQLRAQLQSFWPGALIFADVDSPISLAFLKRCPSPAYAKGPGPRRPAGLLAPHRYSGRRCAEELLERMRSAPVGRAGGLEAEARRAVVVGLVGALEPIVAEISELTSQIRGALAAPATLIAALGDCRGATRPRRRWPPTPA